MCEGEESDGDEDEGGVPGDQSADQVEVNCAHQISKLRYPIHIGYRFLRHFIPVGSGLKIM